MNRTVTWEAFSSEAEKLADKKNSFGIFVTASSLADFRGPGMRHRPGAPLVSALDLRPFDYASTFHFILFHFMSFYFFQFQ